MKLIFISIFVFYIYGRVDAAQFGEFTIQNDGSIHAYGLCLDVTNANQASKTPLQFYKCNETPAQSFTIESDGSIRIYGKCVDVFGGSKTPGTPVQTFSCNGTPAQKWRFVTGNFLNGKNCLVPKTGAGNVKSGTPAVVGDCSGAGNYANQNVVIKGLNGLCLDVAGANKAPKTPVQLFTCNNTPAQAWTIGTDGTFQALGECMDVAGASTTDGAPVQIFDCNKTGAQQWSISSTGQILNKLKCLEAVKDGTKTGMKVQIQTCNGSEAQKFTVGSS